MKKILWVTANFNHYKARVLDHLASDKDIELTLITGTGRKNMGDKELSGDFAFNHIKVDVPKHSFGYSKKVCEVLKHKFKEHDWVLIPAEKKNLILFIYSLWLRFCYTKTSLFSYNHPISKSGGGKVSFLDKVISKFYFKCYNKIIFYTEQSCKWAINNKLISAEKAGWANNTIDTTEINKYYSFQLPPISPKILFIGRLIASKRILKLLSYYKRLKALIPNLTLDVIGDGPESYYIKDEINFDSSIIWHGSIIDEKVIASVMKNTSLIFVPGDSGLSINQAFSYGRPYITLQNISHGPEIDYIDDGINGYVLSGDFESNINKIYELLSNRSLLKNFCKSAKTKGKYLCILKWLEQIKENLDE